MTLVVLLRVLLALSTAGATGSIVTGQFPVALVCVIACVLVNAALARI